jgi:ABC-type multidrug transport system permease subunit
MLPEQEKAIEKLNAQEYDDLTTAGPAMLAWRSTWLDQRAYAAVNHDWRPLRRGITVLAVALAIAAIARLIGTGLGILTSPQIDVLQDQIFNALSGTAYIESLAAQSPEFAAQFAAGYTALWELIRLLGGYPSYTGLAGALIGLLFTFGSWLTYASLAFVVGRWLGAEASYGRTLGVFALAYTPVMLTVVEAVPGAYVAWSLIFLLILVAKFLAAREVFQLGPGGGLAAVLLPYLLGLILLIGLLIFAAALGLNQVPYLDEILRTLRFTGGIP